VNKPLPMGYAYQFAIILMKALLVLSLSNSLFFMKQNSFSYFRLLLLLVACLASAPVWAQTTTISGRVTERDGSTLPGATVLERGTTNGVSTNADGAFSLNVQPNATLVISSVGYTSQTIAVGSQKVLNIALATSTMQLSEAVVVGYGTQTKSDLTGSVATVGAKEINNTPVTSFEQAIQGKAAGVFIESGSGKLGQAVKVRVRGTSSVSGDTQPLYVIDGIPITSEDQSGTLTTGPSNPIADLNPNDIESISILKDASSSAIYGSRGSNGVILITTKHGKSGPTKFTLGYQTGVSEPTHKKSYLNSADYVMLEREAAANENKRDTTFDYVAYTEARLRRFAGGNDSYKTAAVNTDWQNEVFQRAPFSQYDLGANGGDEKTRFYIAGNYTNQKGILINNKFEKMNARINVDHTASKRLTIGVNLNLARTKNTRLDNDNSFGTPLQIVALSPITPVYDPRTGLLSGALDPATGQPNNNFPLYYNPLLSVENASFVTTVFRTVGNVYGQFKIVDGLSFRSEAGGDMLNQNENSYQGRLTARNTDFTSNGNGYNGYVQNMRYTLNNFFTYQKHFGEQHSIEAVVGTSFEERHINSNSVTGQQFPSDAFKYITSAGLINSGSSGSTGSTLLSYFARANYAFASKYLLTLSGRIDGSSKFGVNNRYGFFPAASVGWVVTDEAFLRDQKVLSLLKPRISYGKTGNQGFGDFISRSLYSGGAYAGGPTIHANQTLGNPDLKWESTTQADAGLEFGFLDNRITGEVDVYQKKTTGLVLSVNTPGVTGFTNQFRNVGSLENKGVEFTLTTRNAVGAFNWTTTFNAATNQNKITNLDKQILNGGFVNRAVEGQPIGVFYTVEYAGVDRANGDALYWKNTTNDDGSSGIIDHTKGTTSDYNQANRVVVGNPNPRWTGGVTNTLAYKGLELNFTFQGVFGNKVFNGGGSYQSANASNGFDNQTTDQLARWQKPGDITNVPQARLFEANGTANSTRYLSNGDYVRLKTATLSYTLPANVVSKAMLDRVRLFVTGVNLLTFTKYQGWDPEVNADYQASNIGQGNDFYSAPQARTYTVGVNVGF
jgi:TonB-linked SusC/RagA family outer membrane protein